MDITATAKKGCLQCHFLLFDGLDEALDVSVTESYVVLNELDIYISHLSVISSKNILCIFAFSFTFRYKSCSINRLTEVKVTILPSLAFTCSAESKTSCFTSKRLNMRGAATSRNEVKQVVLLCGVLMSLRVGLVIALRTVGFVALPSQSFAKDRQGCLRRRLLVGGQSYLVSTER